MCLFVWFCFVLFCPLFGVSSVRPAFAGFLLPRPGGSPYSRPGRHPSFTPGQLLPQSGSTLIRNRGRSLLPPGTPQPPPGGFAQFFFAGGRFFSPRARFQAAGRVSGRGRRPIAENSEPPAVSSAVHYHSATCESLRRIFRRSSEAKPPLSRPKYKKIFFFVQPPYSVNSPRSDFFSCRFTSSDVYPAPSRYIIFVTAASVVMSRPLTTPMRCSPSPVS